MATTIQGFRITPGRPLSRLSTHAHSARPCRSRRYFQTIPPWRADDVGKESDVDSTSLNDPSSFDPSNPPPITPLQGKKFEDIMKRHGHIRQNMSEELQNLPIFREIKPGRPKPGAMNMGVPASENPEDDPEFEDNDISSMAHRQLEQHREYRHYARLAAWEMPLLTKMAKDFIPPTHKEVLRFRYTNYMGEQHPAEKKVVVEFCPADMPDLSDIQRDKLKKLVGTRWNPETDVIKMSCEMFETQAQNKRYLGDLVDTLLQEARDPTDTFEDIPLDTRHHQIKVKPKFPTEWLMTDGRRAELEAFREHAQLTDQQKDLQGAIVDGVQQIQAALSRSAAARAAAAAAEPITVTAGRAAGKVAGKGKKSRQR